jgi:hypothetical protein
MKLLCKLRFNEGLFVLGLAGLLFSTLILPQAVHAQENSLEVSTKSQVEEDGRVTVFLTLKNTGSRPLFEIHPMFHFHHSNSMMAMIPKLEPGEKVVLENGEHPPVVRVGRYPLVVMAHYKKEREQSVPLTLLYTDSFYYQEPVVSEVGGRIESVVESKGSFLKVLLQNNSTALKNVRMMLLLPPGVIAEKFTGMIGFTLRSGQKKYFEVPVKQTAESLAGSFPVHLMIEYGESLKHFTGDIRGEIQFGSVLDSRTLGLHSAVIALMSLGLYVVYRMKWKRV